MGAGIIRIDSGARPEGRADAAGGTWPAGPEPAFEALADPARPPSAPVRREHV